MSNRTLVLRRCLFSFLSVVSLILCLATGALWAQGASGFYCWSRAGGNMYMLASDSNEIGLAVLGPWPCSEHRWNSKVYPASESEPVSASRYPLGVKMFLSRGVVAVNSDGRVPWTVAGRWSGLVEEPSIPYTSWSIRAPSWLLLALLTPLPATWMGTLLVRYEKNRRRRLNARTHCLSCGYNLTGNTSGVCPECGTRIAARVKA